MGRALLVELSYARAGLVIDPSHLSWHQPYEKILISGSKFFPLRDLGRDLSSREAYKISWNLILPL